MEVHGWARDGSTLPAPRPKRTRERRGPARRRHALDLIDDRACGRIAADRRDLDDLLGRFQPHGTLAGGGLTQIPPLATTVVGDWQERLWPFPFGIRQVAPPQVTSTNRARPDKVKSSPALFLTLLRSSRGVDDFFLWGTSWGPASNW